MAEGTGLPPQLIAYWTTGVGAAKIKWGVSGDFNRCRINIQQAVTTDGQKPLSPRVIDGLCATLHEIATGATPGNAPSERTTGH